MLRLMIADSDEIFLSIAKGVLEADFQVETCQDGTTALEMLSTFTPDALIINLSLPFKDGITVLRESAKLPPVIIAIVANTTPYVEQACLELNVGYLMISPCLNALRVQLICLVNAWQNAKSDLRAQALMHLHILNFPTHRVGYRQLCDALPIYCRDRNMCLETVLYAEVARIHNANVRSVERAMREVIKQAWEHRDKLVWSKYFRNLKSAPSNKVFFDALADFIIE